MNAAFDTLVAARELEAAGVGRKEAEAIAAMGRQAAGANCDRPATRADIEDFATKADIAALETRLTVRFFGGLVAVGGSIVAAVKLL